MKRMGLLVLLVSLGLNLGLAMKMVKSEKGSQGMHSRHEGRWSSSQERHWPARGDTAAWRRMGRQRMDRVTDRLGLSDEQAEAFRESHDQTMLRLADRKIQVKETRSELRSLMAADEIDSAAVRATLHELGRQQAVLDSLVTESFMAELGVLEPEQRSLYLQMMPFGDDQHRPGRVRRGRSGSHD